MRVGQPILVIHLLGDCSLAFLFHRFRRRIPTCIDRLGIGLLSDYLHESPDGCTGSNISRIGKGLPLDWDHLLFKKSPVAAVLVLGIVIFFLEEPGGHMMEVLPDGTVQMIEVV